MRFILTKGASSCHTSFIFFYRFRHRSRSSSASIEGKSHESVEKFVTYTIPPSVEAVMEKVVLTNSLPSVLMIVY